jgi:NADH dehydrogenase FAD-containing subunit
MTLNDDGITFREVNADELEKIPVAALIWAARLQAHIQARQTMNRARAAAANN